MARIIAKMDTETALKEVSRVGRFQVLLYLLYGLQGACFSVWDVLSITSFIAATPEYYCQYGNDVNTEELMIYNSEYMPSSENLNTTELLEYNCADGNVVFNPEPYGKTIVTEWYLIGSQATAVELSQSVFMVGMMIGSIVLGQLSDNYGRKPVLVLSVVMSPLLGLALAFSPNIWIFIMLRFLVGLMCPGAILTTFILAMELFPLNIRASLGIAMSVFNALGYVLLSVMAFAIKDWRHLQIVMSGIRIILLPLCYFVPESFQWLIVRGKTVQLEQVLQKIVFYNNIKVAYPILGKDQGCDPYKKIGESQPSIAKNSDPYKQIGEIQPSIAKDSYDQLSEKSKSFDNLFLYDSAFSLERDYIPAENQYTDCSINDESEEEDKHSLNVCNFNSTTRSMTTSLLAFQGTVAAPRRKIGVSDPVENDCQSNLYQVNSSISILSDLQEQLLPCDSFEDFFEQSAVPSISVPIENKHTSFFLQPNRSLRKKSVSLCHIPNFVEYISEVQGTSYNRVRNMPHQVKYPSNFNKDLLMRTSSTPQINGSMPAGDTKHEAELNPNILEEKNKGFHKRKRGTPNLLTIPIQENNSNYILSIPMLALPFSFSQTIFPGMGREHFINFANVSQSTDTLQDNTSGFESSFSNIPQSIDYQCDSVLHEQTPLEGEDTFVDNLKKKVEKNSYHAIDLFRTSSIRMYTICGMIIWFSTYSIYVGLSMSTDGLAGDPYINFICSGLVEVPAVIISLVANMRFGRRLPSITLHFLAIISCCIYLILPTHSETTLVSSFSVGAILLAKTFTAAAYYLEGLVCLELLPIPLRNSWTRSKSNYTSDSIVYISTATICSPSRVYQQLGTTAVGQTRDANIICSHLSSQSPHNHPGAGASEFYWTSLWPPSPIFRRS